MSASEHKSEFIELSGPDLTELEWEAALAVLKGRRLSLGPIAPRFEQAIADYVGCRYAVAVNSGTSALHLIVRALGLGENDEVITTPFSFIASANCLLYERARPVFVDIDEETLNLDCDAVEAAITPRTKAILAVDIFGLPADWERLEELARRHGLLLIEDSCEALGARLQRTDGVWRMAGSFAQAGAFAFYPNKQITTGEGGMIVTDDQQIAQLCRSMRNQGRDENAEWLHHARLGYNYRLSDINAALGLAQLSRLDEILEKRRTVACWYNESLAGISNVSPLKERRNMVRSWFVYVVQLTSCRSREELGSILTALRSRGIACSNYFFPIHLQPFYQEQFGFRGGEFPVTESVSVQTLALPFHSKLTRPEVERVVGALKETLAEFAFA